MSLSNDVATKNLFSKLKRIAESEKILFGQEFSSEFMSSQQNMNTDTSKSDVNDIVGDYVAVHGTDIHYYLYKSAEERQIHTDAVLSAHKKGQIITVDFHMYARNTQSYGPSSDSPALVKRIIDKEDKTGTRAWMKSTFDDIIAYADKHFPGIPFIFRPFHEMNGNWFWWGALPAEDYISLYRFLHDYVTKEKKFTRVLWCWSPDKVFAKQYYPGKDYVDIIAVDVYEPGLRVPIDQFVNTLGDMVDFAKANGQVAALTETGSRDEFKLANVPRFWTEKILNPIKNDPRAVHIAWISAWFNAPASWGSFPYTPHKNFENADAIQDFKKFYNDPTTMFLRDYTNQKSEPRLPSPPTPKPPKPSEQCTDIPTGDGFTCEQQKGWGKCSVDFMKGKCDRTCGRCKPSRPSGPCTDIPTGDGFTCEQQKGWGKCSVDFMKGKCDRTCGRCVQNAEESTTTTEANTQEEPSKEEGVHPALIVVPVVVISSLLLLALAAVIVLRKRSTVEGP